MAVETFQHATGADLEYQVQWDVHDTDPIVSEVFTVISGGAGFAVSTIAPDGKVRKLRATGGLQGATYVVRHQVTLTSGYVDSRTLNFVVTNR